MNTSTTSLCLILNYFFGLNKLIGITDPDELHQHLRRKGILEKLTYLIYLTQEHGLDLGYHFEVTQNDAKGWHLNSTNLITDLQDLWANNIPPWPDQELKTEIQEKLQAIVPCLKIKFKNLSTTESIKYLSLTHYLSTHSKYEWQQVLGFFIKEIHAVPPSMMGDIKKQLIELKLLS